MDDHLRKLRSFLSDHLEEQIIPFWVNHAVDLDKGGIFTYLLNDGTIFDRRKSIISNTRALWTFSALARRNNNQSEWREAADSIYRFLIMYGQDSEGLWNFLVHEDGSPIIGNSSIISGAFAIYGLVEYYRLSGTREALDLARKTYLICRKHLLNPGSYQAILYPTPSGMLAHRESMHFSLMFFELAVELGDSAIMEKALSFSNNVLDIFYRKDHGVLLEYIGPDGEEWDTAAGRAMVPGHGIESLWYQILINSSAHVNNHELAKRAAQAMQCCFEKGWDSQYGGIFLGIDVKGKDPPFWKLPEMKRWWPHCESLCGALMAYEQLGESWCLDWYWKIHDWTFARFPDRDNGEWIQNLDRKGMPFKFNGVENIDRIDIKQLSKQTGVSEVWLNYDFRIKDPFHTPRALIMAIDSLDRMG